MNRILLTLGVVFATAVAGFAQGSLTPPGAPAPLFKTLQQVEPRTPISSLPFNITNTGSYYLTTNLTGIAVSNGITILANDVTIDLNGFVLAGLSGSGDGIVVSGARTNISVHNGTVRGWGGDGVDTFSAVNSQLEGLRASANGARGIAGGTGCVIDNCTARQNGGDGITVSTGGTIRHCTAQFNTGDGIATSSGATVSGCASSQNGDDGIVAGLGNTVSGCTAYDNVGDGISTGTGSTISGCTAYNNFSYGINAAASCTISSSTAYNNAGIGIEGASGSTIQQCSAYSNSTNGISVVTGSAVIGCTVRLNTGHGISAGSSCRVENNACTINTLAQITATSTANRIDGNHCQGGQNGLLITGTDNLIVRNSVQGATVLAYDIAAGNHIATAIVSPGIGFASSSPWANFSF